MALKYNEGCSIEITVTVIVNQYEEKLKKFLSENCIQAEHLSFERSCHSVVDAASAANAAVDDLVKNICMMTSQGDLIVAIVKGDNRASTTRVSKVLGGIPTHTATPEQILEKTGYPCGGTPSFGFPAKFLIDPRVTEKEIIYTGGGSPSSLVRVATKELQRANQGQIIRVRK